MGFFTKVLGAVGKAIPNEVSKVNSVTKYIPYVGQVSQLVSGLDAAATGYSDTRERGGTGAQAIANALQGGSSGFMGSVDPGQYGSPNINRDVFNLVGQAGNMFTMDGGKPQFNTRGLPDILNNPYFFKQPDITGTEPEPETRLDRLIRARRMGELASIEQAIMSNNLGAI